MDWLIVGLGNPGREYERTRHNVGFLAADRLIDRWDLGRPRKRYGGLIAEGRAGIGGPQVAVLMPQTFMNDSGRSAGPARRALKLPLGRGLALPDEIALPCAGVRTRRGGGLAGHNGLKSLRRELGSPDFWRVRMGVGRLPSSDPDTVAAYVLARFRAKPVEVDLLVEEGADAAARLVVDPG